MPVQKANIQRADLVGVDNQRNGYSWMHGCWENYGIYNGQYEIGPPGQLETEPPDGEKIAVFTPMTLPSVSNVGPPELPLFTGASI